MAKEIPILFSTPMVQAILDGRKTQTRRIVKGLPDGAKDDLVQIMVSGHHSEHGHVTCRYGKTGDILWVRESFISGYKMEDGCFEYDEHGEQIPKTWYKASDPNLRWYDGTSDYPVENTPWKPSIHMPKEAARIWLQVEDVRVERLMDISEDDAMAEGILQCRSEIDNRIRYKDYLADAKGYGHPDHDYPTVGLAVTSFCTLWEKINGPDSWYSNPWVWVISFKVISTTGRPESI